MCTWNSKGHAIGCDAVHKWIVYNPVMLIMASARKQFVSRCTFLSTYATTAFKEKRVLKQYPWGTIL